MNKIQIVIEDGIIESVRADENTKEMLRKNDILLQIVDFDRDYGDTYELHDFYSEELADIPYDLIHCDESDEA